MLGPDAPFAELAQIWEDMLNGFPTTLNVKVRLQASSGIRQPFTTDMTWFDIHDSSIMGFSDGTTTAAYVVIQPGFITFDNAKDHLVNTRMGRWTCRCRSRQRSSCWGKQSCWGCIRRAAGTVASHRTVIQPGPRWFRLPTCRSLPSRAGTKREASSANLAAFGQLRDWINAILQGSIPPQRSVVFKKVTNLGAVLATVQYTDCIPTRINFVNPVLVEANGGVAPYVFDLRLRPTSVQ